MTAKFDSFIAALENLCEVHGVSIDCGYGGMAVYNNPIRDGEPLDKNSDNWFRDMTDYV